MAGMELDDQRGRSPRLSARDRIVQRLSAKGVPREVLEQSEMGLRLFLNDNPAMVPELVSAILPTEGDVSELQMLSKTVSGGPSNESNITDFLTDESNVTDLFTESMLWLGWIMFGDQPQSYLEKLAKKAGGQRAVCGAVWGHNDLAYRCRTCENDPTCAICVPCFLNGNHKDHDYSIIYTGGGCCDCGDETAWKSEGFCSEHRGIRQFQPLPEELAISIRPVLDSLFFLWKSKLSLAEKSRRPNEYKKSDISSVMGDRLSSAVVKMLLHFCECSESLLSFTSIRMFQCTGLLDLLVRAERFLHKSAVKRLHELLLKLLGEPIFKYEFAKVFIEYYPVAVNEMAIGGPDTSNDTVLEKYPLLSTFSVQIFTVPTLMARLVQEVNLLGVLLECLRDLLFFCVGDEGHVQANRWVMDLMIRLVEDIRFVLSHEEVLIHVTYEEPDISRTWLKLLTLAQGMNPHKRVTTTSTDDEYENISTAFLLGHLIGNVSNLFVQGAFSASKAKQGKDTSLSGSQGLDDNEGYRHSKVGRTSQESSVFITNRSGQLDCSSRYSHARMDGIGSLSIPSLAIQLISECLKSIDGWLCLARNISHNNDDSSCSCFNSLRKKVFRLKKGANIYKVCRTSVTRQGIHVHQQLALEHSERFDSMDTDMSADDPSSSRLSDNITEVDAIPDAEAFGMLNVIDWPDIVYDVSSQGISFHIPLHCLLSLILRKAMEDSYGETKKPVKTSSGFLLPSSVCSHDFFGQVLGVSQPCGFSAFLMEHPLRLRVFCAQVRAGMWRRSADTTICLSEFYRAGQWINQGLESDLFFLQCCAALAPPELFVRRIQERFGLSNYTSLNISEYNEYEPVLVNEMLILILQIVKERCFSGLSTVDHLKREVIYKLAVGDATHSQVLKALPRDLSKSDQVQNILDTLATYSNPSGMKQGKYSLRRAYWNELDLYHPRWNYRDLQIAEERYFRFCKVSARNVQLPRWTDTYPPLATISRIATSKTVLEIVRAVFFYAALTDVSLMSRAPDGVLITALHLLSLALDICCSLSNASTSNFFSDDGSSFMEVSHNQEDLPPLLAHATDVLDLTSLPESELWKNQNMLSLLVLLMKKYKDEGDGDYSEMRHCNISSLIKTLLKKFAELSSDCLIFLQKLAPEVVCQILKQPAQVPPESLTSASDGAERRAKARERQAAIMEKMRAEQSRFIANLKSHNEGDTSKEEKLNLEDIADVESEIVCSLCRDSHSQSPLCFLILLQKSRLTTFIEQGPPSWEDVCWENKIQSGGKEHSDDSSGSGSDSNSMVQLDENFAVQSPFDLEPVEVVTLLGSLEEQLPDMRKIHTLNMFPGTGREDSIPLEKLEDDIYLSVVRNILNSKSSPGDLVREEIYLNNNTADNSKKDRLAEFFVLGECVVRLLRESKQNHSSIYGLQRIANLSSRSVAPSVPINGFGPCDCDGIHISSCGHAVHHECHDRYLSSLKQRYNRRLGFEGIHIVNPEMGELLCPVCRSFANSILPASTGVSKIFSMGRTSIFNNSTSNDFPSVSLDTNRSNLHILPALSLLQNAAKMVGESRVLKVLSGSQIQPKNSALEPALKKLFMLYYPLGYHSLSEAGRHSHLLILWDTLRYSITSTEIAARAKLNGYSVTSCLEYLTEELHSSSRYVMSSLLHAAQSIRSYNSFDVLLRFSSLQLLAGSICSGLSGDNYFSNGDRSKDKPSLFECSHNGGTFPDVQFWKRAADPILAHDPFSSLMWVLFCLPMPFICSREYFIALVHLFYVICIVQATIACYGKQGFDISSFGGHFGNICKMMTEPQSVRQFFVSNYDDELCDPKNMIRRRTLPYLLRCALLWNLLDSSTLAPSFDSHMRERSYLCLKDADLDIDDQLKVELSRIGELEDMFKICSLESVLKDEVVHALALKWCEHFQKEFRVRKYRGILAVTPAVPFKLMELPFIYQDLLQRYIKVPCSSCKSVPEEPALCLLCGTLCSLSKKPCCRLRKCSNHAMICGAGVSVFLLVRSTIIFLQRSNRQAFWPSPYLDAFGEEDRNMSRGKPLYLSKERYAALTYLVASHGLDRNSEVLRQTSINPNVLE